MNAVQLKIQNVFGSARSTVAQAAIKPERKTIINYDI